MQKLLFFLLIIFLIGGVHLSCTKTIDPKLDDIEPLMVVNGLFSKDSIVKVNVSKSIGILENEWEIDPPYLDNAIVKLFEDNQLVSELDYAGEGNYIKSDLFPNPQKQYRIEISATDLPDVKSSLEIPDSVSIKSVDTTLNILYWDTLYGYGDLELEFSLKYNDPPNMSNYYILEAFITYSDEFSEYREKAYIDVPEIDQDKYDIIENILLWNDFLSDGEEVEIKGSVYFYTGGFDIEEKEGVQIELCLRSLHEDYYLFKKSFYAARNSGFDNPFVEPVQVYSNIENGLGIFSAYSTSSFFMDFIMPNIKEHE